MSGQQKKEKEGRADKKRIRPWAGSSQKPNVRPQMKNYMMGETQK